MAIGSCRTIALPSVCNVSIGNIVSSIPLTSEGIACFSPYSYTREPCRVSLTPHVPKEPMRGTRLAPEEPLFRRNPKRMLIRMRGTRLLLLYVSKWEQGFSCLLGEWLGFKGNLLSPSPLSGVYKRTGFNPLSPFHRGSLRWSAPCPMLGVILGWVPGWGRMISLAGLGGFWEE